MLVMHFQFSKLLILIRMDYNGFKWFQMVSKYQTMLKHVTSLRTNC